MSHMLFAVAADVEILTDRALVADSNYRVDSTAITTVFLVNYRTFEEVCDGIFWQYIGYYVFDELSLLKLKLFCLDLEGFATMVV